MGFRASCDTQKALVCCSGPSTCLGSLLDADGADVGGLLGLLSPWVTSLERNSCRYMV